MLARGAAGLIFRWSNSKSIQWNTQNFQHGAGFSDPSCRNLVQCRIKKIHGFGAMGGYFTVCRQ